MLLYVYIVIIHSHLSFLPFQIADYYEEGVLKFTESMTEDESWGEYEDEINKFIDYLEKTWIGRILGRSNARQSPMFKYEMWSLHRYFRRFQVYI